jgi:hypothetical protein
MSQPNQEQTNQRTITLNRKGYEYIALKGVLDKIEETGIEFTAKQWLAITKNIRNLREVMDAHDKGHRALEKKFGHKVKLGTVERYEVKADKAAAYQAEITELLKSTYECEIIQLNADQVVTEAKIKSLKGLNYFFELGLFDPNDTPNEADKS